ncbi:MAG: GTPase [Thermoplasmata archaeon]|nr:GTPase [Thermoplasmata archaeon]
MRFLYFVGTAGSGKSTLVQAYKEWLDYNGVDSIIVNLDPGSDSTPYNADIDIREWIYLDEVMQKYNLGPNGAQVVAADLMAMNIDKLVNALSDFRTKYVLIDTPGQLELFAFRDASQKIIESLGREKSMVVYTADPILYKTSNGFVSGMMLSMLVQFRLQLPTINILTKSDLLSEEDRDKFINWYNDPVSLYGDLLDNDANPQTMIGMELFRTLENVGVFGDLRTVSAQESEGMEEIYGASQLAFFGGEDPDID